MHRTLWLFAVVDYAPNSCFARRECGARRAPAKFKSTIRSTTNPLVGCSGLCPRMERLPVTRTMQLSFCGRYQKAHGRKSDWYVSGHRQQTNCRRGNDDRRGKTSFLHSHVTEIFSFHKLSFILVP